MKAVFRSKQDRIVPVYDTHGNLLWPKQMSYEEVKKYVAEREAKQSKPKQKDWTRVFSWLLPTEYLKNPNRLT